MKTPLADLNMEKLVELVSSLGEKSYRAKQIMRHITAYDGFAEYTDLPKSLIQKLSENYSDRVYTEKTRAESKEGAVRYLLEMSSGELVETVFLPHDYGNSVCVSCQIGCGMGCVFCASGHYGLNRSLSAGEILSQALFVARDKKDAGGVKKIVMMGSGEPLANYDNTVEFIKSLNSKDGLGIGMRSVSVSTCGIVPNIYKLADSGLPVTLSLSLHAATDEKRTKIMSVAKNYAVKELVAALEYYFRKTGRRVIIEYILIGGFNDGQEDVIALKTLLKGLCCHINLIPLNPTDHCELAPCSKKHAYEFCASLERAGLSATVRRSMGSDVAGACGQLKNRTQENARKNL